MVTKVESYHKTYRLHEVESMVRKINPVLSNLWVLGLGIWMITGVACTGGGAPNGMEISSSQLVTMTDTATPMDLSGLPSMPSRWLTSAYFDRAMGVQGARFQVVSFSQLVGQEPGNFDAVLLNCVDDYQGIVAIADIRKYNLQLATRLELPATFEKPDWLNPLMIIVPEGGTPVPFQERFLTANIRELRLVRLRDYYAPIDRIGQGMAGLPSFKDNCLFCHSLMGIGGNKGVPLLPAYDVSTREDRARFHRDFSGFHHPASSQNLQQFVDESALEDILDFLKRVADASRSP